MVLRQRKKEETKDGSPQGNAGWRPATPRSSFSLLLSHSLMSSAPAAGRRRRLATNPLLPRLVAVLTQPPVPDVRPSTYKPA
jgi:hypothetical protein